MQKKVLLLLSVLSAALLSSASEFRLVVDGKPHGRIQGNPDPTACEFRAVTELQEAIAKISKAKLPRTTMPGPVFRIYRNEGLDKVELMCVTLAKGRRLLPEKALKKLEGAESPDAFYIISEDSPKTGKAIFIAGKTPAAVVANIA